MTKTRLLNELIGLFGIVFISFILLIAGCHTPTLMPMAPLSVQHADGQRLIRNYDVNQDSIADYIEELAGDGRVAVLRIDHNFDGRMESEIFLDPLRNAGLRHMVLILDSVPFEMVQSLWKQGRFRYFHPPSRIIAPFPVMTDLSLAEFFGVSPCPGVESEYYDGRELTRPFDTYAQQKNSPWTSHLNYILPSPQHFYAYLWPQIWFYHELGGFEKAMLQSTDSPFIGYMVATSAEGAKYGRNGHLQALIDLDRSCQSLMRRLEGRLHITLLSDHGHNLIQGKFIRLARELQQLGYHVTTRLQKSGDVVVPEFGVVTCAAIYTREPAGVAADVVQLEGMDLAAYRDDDAIVVLSQNGRAKITRKENRYGYQTEWGDPLKLNSLLQKLSSQGKLDKDHTAADEDFFLATQDHEYPDPLHRIWRAFHGLMVHTPNVLVSVQEDYFVGSSTINQFITLRAAHGSLRDVSSNGFVMTTTGQLPPVMRMENLRQELQSLGVGIGGGEKPSH